MKEARRFKVKVDGEERDVSEEDLLRDYQAREASSKRFREAAELEGKARSLMQALQQRPDDFLEAAKSLGVDPNKLAQSVMGKLAPAEQRRFAEAILAPMLEQEIAALEEQALPPEERRSRELQRENAELKRQAEARKQQDSQEEQKRQQAAQVAEVEKHRDEFAGVIQQALEATRLPKTHALALELTNRLADMLERGEPVDAKLLAKDLEDSRVAEYLALQKGTKDLSLVDPELLKLARARELEEQRKSNPLAFAKPVVGKGKAQPQEQPEKKSVSMNSVIRDLMMGKGVKVPG